MVGEYCQILSTTHRIIDGQERVKTDNKGRETLIWELPDELDEILMQVSEPNQPINEWVRQSIGNYQWAFSLLNEICNEFEIRNGKTHILVREGLVGALANPPKNIPMGDFSEPPQAISDKYKIEGDTITAYRNFYKSKGEKLLKWRKTKAPDWL
ncbi:MAG: hypothetical protein J0L55_12945 [Caulobacterales bacterium]|nr:hypothetical protein [Caulobacterales bacterium]MCA0372944.1 hypothetical protein [Pseudomonadota bacterium]